MTECVHEWDFYENGGAEIICTHQNCWETMSLDEAKNRLNATERLLRKAFRNGRVWSDVLIVQDALREFRADILED